MFPRESRDQAVQSGRSDAFFSTSEIIRGRQSAVYFIKTQKREAQKRVGDIDKEGYEIYSLLKKAHADLKPVFMDFSIIERYHRLHQKKAIFLGPYREVPGLQREYEHVSRQGIQIEQEQLRESWPFAEGLL